MDIQTEARLAQLESNVEAFSKSSRRWKLACAALGLGAIGAIALAAGEIPSRVLDAVTTEQLRVVDAEGNVLVQIGHDSDGGTFFLNNTDGNSIFEVYGDREKDAVLMLSGRAGNTGIGISASGKGGHMTVNNADETGCVLFGADDTGRGYTFVANENGTPQIEHTADAEGGVIRLFNNRGASVVEAFADENLMGLFAVNGATGDDRGTIISTDRDGGSVSTYNNDGIRTAMVYSTADGRGEIITNDQDGFQRSMIGSDVDGGRVFLTNKNDATVVGQFVDPNGRGVFAIRDDSGDNRVALHVDDDGGAFYLTNAKDATVIEGYASPEGDGLIILSNANARTRLELVGSKDAGNIRYWDQTTGESPARIESAED